jgi:hypothetical protein
VLLRGFKYGLKKSHGNYLALHTLHRPRLYDRCRIHGSWYPNHHYSILVGNWATDLLAGSKFQYAFLFVILMSNIIAILLQHLAIKLGVVSNMDLAQACRKHFNIYFTAFLYVLCEIAIMVYLFLLF